MELDRGRRVVISLSTFLELLQLLLLLFDFLDLRYLPQLFFLLQSDVDILLAHALQLVSVFSIRRSSCDSVFVLLLASVLNFKMGLLHPLLVQLRVLVPFVINQLARFIPRLLNKAVFARGDLNVLLLGLVPPHLGLLLEEGLLIIRDEVEIEVFHVELLVLLPHALRALVLLVLYVVLGNGEPFFPNFLPLHGLFGLEVAEELVPFFFVQLLQHLPVVL
mmetsp:Transcript_1944/g.2450  ORF Transcript_1944/g.2450 Transcript_1944/m.2450 type:complete len:220 (-) Transcript_1944:561-1220(-)